MSKRKKAVVEDRVLERARAHPETATITLGGEEFLFLLQANGMKRARAKGTDPVPVIFSLVARFVPLFQAMAGEMQFGALGGLDNVKRMVGVAKQVITTEGIEEFAVVLWAGLLTFDPDLSLEEVEVMLTPRTIYEVVNEVAPKILSFAEDMEDEAGESTTDESAEGDGSGN